MIGEKVGKIREPRRTTGAISRGTSADGVIVLGRSEVVGSSRDAASRLAPFRIDADHRRSAKLADIALKKEEKEGEEVKVPFSSYIYIYMVEKNSDRWDDSRS